MAVIRDVDIGCFDHSVPRDVRLRVNSMSNSISRAYLIALRARKVDFGGIKKLLVSLHREAPSQALEDAVDVYIYNCRFDFADFERSSYKDRCYMILETLHVGLLEICKALGSNVGDFVTSYEEVMAYDFVFKYRRGQPVANKKAGLAAQLGTIQTPAWTSVVAYLQSLEDGHEVDTLAFIKKEDPDLRFEDRYLGKLKWISASRLALIPKDRGLSPIELDIVLVH